MSVNKARLAQEILGVGAGGGLEKLTISYERAEKNLGLNVIVGNKVEAMFNPAEIVVSRSATWEQRRTVGRGTWASRAVKQEFRSAEAATFTTSLFFDTYESRQGGFGWRHVVTSVAPATLLGARSATDVRTYTDRVAGLTEVDTHLHRPPICTLKWGRFDIFRGVLTKVEQRFTLFLEDGTPVRATLSCTFTEFTDEPRARARELQSADVHKTRQVRRNDSLHSLAAEEYGDPALWRHIARANGIVNPRDLAPGTVLMIPRLRT